MNFENNRRFSLIGMIIAAATVSVAHFIGTGMNDILDSISVFPSAGFGIIAYDIFYKIKNRTQTTLVD